MAIINFFTKHKNTPRIKEAKQFPVNKNLIQDLNKNGGASEIVQSPYQTSACKKLMNQIYIRELMTTDVTCVDVGASLDDVIALMHKHTHSCIVIINEKNPVGIITERDLVKILAEVLVSGTKEIMYVKDFMSSPPACLSEHASLYEALVVTQSRKIRHIPIVNKDNVLVGLITQSDIAKAHFMAIEKQREAIEQHIRNRTHELTKANEQLKALALQDGLLGIGNRRAMEVDIHFTHVNAVRYSHPYALALIDVDHFKKYNDQYGHQAGDAALKQLADNIKKTIRCGDRLYRYGGEEFLILMPETALFEAVDAINRVLENVHKAHIAHEETEYGCVTLSAGIASLNEANSEDWKSMVEEADRYLYQAKELGRNNTCWSMNSDPSAGFDGSRFSIQ
ncbi:MAG: diguanylate cyclase [Cellvibrionaceae bacterium]